MTDLLLTTTNVPIPFRHTLFKDYNPRRRRGCGAVLRKLDDWNPSDSKPGLLLQGVPNVGKTMLASALLNEYHEGYHTTQQNADVPAAAMLVLLQQKCPVYFIQLAELISLQIRIFRLSADIDQGIREPGEYLDLDRLLQDLKTRVKVLVIDDVGKEHHTSTHFAQDEFDLLVRTRHNHGLTTVYTTNLPLRRWATDYSRSMQSIIERSSLVLEFP
jgi:DNA replication protein DnaC